MAICYYSCILGENQEKITDVRINFTGLAISQIVYLSDVRIAIGNNSTTKFISGSLIIDLKEATNIIYTENGVEDDPEISSDFFLTDSDIFATYKSLYYKQQKDKLYLI